MDEDSGGTSSSFSLEGEIPGVHDGAPTSVKRCRLCADSCEEMVPIFSEQGKGIRLAYNLNKLLPTMIHPLDNLPQEVCMTCIKELNSVCVFVNKCLASQAKLRSMLKMSIEDDGISLKAIEKYSTHWPVADSVKKMGHTREIHATRVKKLLLDSGEGRNNHLKRMKSLELSDDNGVSNQSSHNAEEEIDAIFDPCSIDSPNEGNDNGSDSVEEEHSTVVDEQNSFVSKNFPDKGYHADESNIDGSDRYLCKYCGNGFPWKADLFDHQSTEHSELVNRCVYCRKVFYDKEELESHVIAHEKLLPPGLMLRKRVISPKKKMKKKMFEQSQGINNQFSSSNNSAKCAGIILPDSPKNCESNRTCYYCHLIFPTLRLHRKHVRMHHKIKFPCRFCPNTSVSIYHHKKHEARHLRRAMTCTCKKKFYYYNEFRDHLLIHVHENGQICEICGDTFDCEENLEVHIKTHDGESSYLCELCGEDLYSFFIFRVHKLSHMYPNINRCSLCNFCFPRVEDLDNHLEEVHHTRKVHCGTCGEEFISMELLKQHRASQNCINVSCKVCRKSFPSMSKLRLHAEMHSSDNNYLCDKCGRAFKRKENLRVHLLTSHTPPIPCNVCNREFKSQSRLDVHMQLHKGERTVLCSVCGKSFYTKLALSQHMKTHEEPKIPCPLCGILFIRKAFMLHHMRRHRVACETCGEVFENTPLLADHQRIHVKEGKQPQSVVQPEFPKCQVCGKQFVNIQQLRHHLPVHSEDRPYKCNLCEKSYRRARDLAKHTGRKHGGPKPYHCRFCPCSFMTEQMLFKHENGHTVGKPYNCAMCGIGFWSPLHLEKHLVKHASGNWSSQYQCKDCGKAFPHRNALLIHRNTHAKPLNFKCPFCPRKFSRRGYLQRHNCPLKPKLIQASSTSLQGSTVTAEVSPIAVDGSVLHISPEVPVVEENMNKVSESVDFYKHLKTVTNCPFQEVRTPSVIVVESSDEEEYMQPLHPHLQHPQSSKTVQLVDDIPVYIRKRLFENLPLSTVSSTTLARNLLDQVFTEEALRTCSVKGQRQNSRNLGKREPLCPIGTAAIIAFVQKTNDALGRPPIKSADIVMAMGHRLSELRRRPPINNPVLDVSSVAVPMDVIENPILEIEIY